MQSPLPNPAPLKEKAFQQVKRAQQSKEMFSRLPSIKPKTSSRISMVKIPVNKPNNPAEALFWKIVTDATKVESATLELQQLHFRQAKATPFPCCPLTQVFNWLVSATLHNLSCTISMSHPMMWNARQTNCSTAAITSFPNHGKKSLFLP